MVMVKPAQIPLAIAVFCDCSLYLIFVSIFLIKLQKGFKLKDVFKKSVLTAQQIDSIVRAVGVIHPEILEEYKANRRQSRPDDAVSHDSTIELLSNHNVSELIEEQKEKELKGMQKSCEHLV